MDISRTMLDKTRSRNIAFHSLWRWSAKPGPRCGTSGESTQDSIVGSCLILDKKVCQLVFGDLLQIPHSLSAFHPLHPKKASDMSLLQYLTGLGSWRSVGACWPFGVPRGQVVLLFWWQWRLGMVDFVVDCIDLPWQSSILFFSSLVLLPSWHAWLLHSILWAHSVSPRDIVWCDLLSCWIGPLSVFAGTSCSSVQSYHK